jgi:uncharacterized protein (TIGR03435 family)
MKRSLVGLCVAAIAVLTLTLSAGAQSRSFEVASIKPSNPNPTGPLGAIPLVLPALGRLSAQNVTLRLLVVAAYQKQPYAVIGGPPWQNADKFDINARAEDPAATPEQLLEMLKTLLADRFKLKVHTETREIPLYALVVARSDRRLGPKMKPSSDVCPDLKEEQQKQLEAFAKGGLQAIVAAAPKPGEKRPCSVGSFATGTTAIGLRASGQPMSTLALLLTQLMGRPVLDKTNLAGGYDFDLTLDIATLLRVAAEAGLNVPAQLPPGIPEGPSLMTVLQEDLGLKLDSQRGPGEVLVIDSAELPTPD